MGFLLETEPRITPFWPRLECILKFRVGGGLADRPISVHTGIQTNKNTPVLHNVIGLSGALHQRSTLVAVETSIPMDDDEMRLGPNDKFEHSNSQFIKHHELRRARGPLRRPRDDRRPHLAYNNDEPPRVHFHIQRTTPEYVQTSEKIAPHGH